MSLLRERACPSCRHYFRHRRGRRHCEACGARLHGRWRWRPAVLTATALFVVTAIAVHRRNEVLRAQVVGSWRVDGGLFAGTTVDFTSGGLFLYADQSNTVWTGSFNVGGARSLHLRDDGGAEAATIKVNVVDGDELVCVNNRPAGRFRGVSGRLRRVTFGNDQ